MTAFKSRPSRIRLDGITFAKKIQMRLLAGERELLHSLQAVHDRVPRREQHANSLEPSQTSPQSAIASDAEAVGLVSNRVSTGIFLPLKILSKELIQTAFFFVNSEEI